MDNEQQRKLQQKIIDLKCDLTSSNSDIGDWKVAKCYEYSLLGKDAPYDVAELFAERQAVRDEINRLETELETMENAQVQA